ncbi:MAG: biopolymer transporter ExbD [Puniceicoccales bacterium]|nr:biopolymer transporter ExbD [Puniceicoccales bacterium]
MPRFSFASSLRLQKPDARVELFDVLNLLLLFCVFFLLNSRFILSPGIAISLPSVATVEARETMGVVTVQSEKFIMFNGNIFSLDTLAQGMKKYLVKNHGENSRGNVILLRPDRSLSVDVLIKVCEIAKNVGYSAVQISTGTSGGEAKR